MQQKMMEWSDDFEEFEWRFYHKEDTKVPTSDDGGWFSPKQ